MDDLQQANAKSEQAVSRKIAADIEYNIRGGIGAICLSLAGLSGVCAIFLGSGLWVLN